MNNFKEGNILSLTLEDFQIFRSQHIEFSPYLNIVVAPNGSGKSSLANAIALLFGGSVKTIGKTKELSEYIRFGCKMATIEAEMFLMGRRMKFKRCIIMNEKKSRYVSEMQSARSQYFIDDKFVGVQEYMVFLRERKINSDNLSVLLAQEKVSSFCTMGAKEVLNELLCISDISLERYYCLKEEKKAIETICERKFSTRRLMESNLQNMEEVLEDCRKIESLEERRFYLECKNIYLRHDDGYSSYKEAKREKKVYEGEIESIRSQIEEYEECMKELNESEIMREHGAMLVKLEEENCVIKELLEKMKENIREHLYLKMDMKSIENKERNWENEKLGIIKEIEKGRERIEALERLIFDGMKEGAGKIVKFYDKLYLELKEKNEYKREAIVIFNKLNDIKIIIDEIPENNEVEIKDKTIISRLYEEMERVIPNANDYGFLVREVEGKMHSIKMRCRVLQNEIDSLESEKVKYSEQKDRRLIQLENYHADTFKGVRWLRNNKDRFHEEVLEPAYLHIEIDDEYRTEVENLLNFQSLSSFLVRNEKDFAELSRVLKDELKLSVNIAEVREPTKSRESTGTQGDKLRKVIAKQGIKGVASDFIRGRQEYVEFIKTYCHLNSIPVSKNDVDEKSLFGEIPGLKRLIANGVYVEIRRSRYGNLCVINRYKLRDSKIFKFPNINIGDIEKKLCEIKSEREGRCREMEVLLESKMGHEKKIAELRKEHGLLELRKNFYSYGELCEHIKRKEREILDVSYTNEKEQNEERQKRNEEEHETILQSLSGVLDLKMISQINVEKADEARVELENYETNMLYALHAKEAHEKAVSEISEKLCKYKEEIRSRKNELKQKISCDYFVRLMGRGREGFVNANADKDVGNTIEPNSLNFLKSKLADLPGDFAGIEAEINLVASKLKVMQGRSGIRNEYEKKEQALHVLSENINELHRKKDELEAEMEQERILLVKKLDKFIAPINSKFSAMFRRFGFRGELECKLEDGEWVLLILVSFRPTEPLTRLSGERQSGGEKSLATVLFLLALQQNTDVGFRLVDEINQGMDATNEKIVFDILSEMSQEKQFFIITPKLVDNIFFSKNTKAIILYCSDGIQKSLENYTNQLK